ncbi:MAG: DUF1579 domain-containing protein [Planctomycetota bacterium]
MHRFIQFALSLMIVCSLNHVSSGQETSEKLDPAKAQKWLTKFVGDWDVVSEGQVEGQPPSKAKAEISAKMLGKNWIVNSSKFDFPGMDMRAIQMIGFDKESGKFVGIWADSMTDFMWHYEGTLDEKTKTLTLAATGPSMTQPDKTAEYRDVYIFKDDDTILSKSTVKTPSGEWSVFMEGTATRKPAK